jgi:alpha-tubulin suppressor-like RCC1 family protein
MFSLDSGFVGQLALGKVCRESTPALVTDFFDEGLSVRKIICGSHHNAAITNSGQLYTWGSQTALGRNIDLPFTPHPGLVAEFGKIVNRIGRGLPRSVACGREYTIVATYPYDGPSEAEELKLSDERRIRDEEESARKELSIKAVEDDIKRCKEIEAERMKIEYLTSKRLCSMDCACPGFTYDANQPSICRECGFSVVYHTIVVDELNEA